MKYKYNNSKQISNIISALKQLENVQIIIDGQTIKFISGVLWILRTGAQWRYLPKEFGKWNSVYKRFRNWTKKDIWTLLLNNSITDPDLEYVMLDSTIVRAHACAAGYGNQIDQGLGRSKGGFTTKIHALVDALGNPLKFIITPGNRNDITQASALLQNVSSEYVLADKGYDSDEFRSDVRNSGAIPVIPSRVNRRHPHPYDKHLYKERHLIECFFSKIKHFRRVFSRYEKQASMYHAFLSIIGAYLWMR